MVWYKNKIFAIKIGKTVVKKIKYFRVMIDDKLNWSQHIRTIKNILVKAKF